MERERAPLGDDDILISRPAFTRRIRRVGLVGNTALGLASAALDRPPSFVGGFAAIVAVLAAFEVRDRLRRAAPRSTPWPLTVAAIMTVVAAVILLTGGVDSVFLILLVPIGFTLGFSTPDMRAAAAPAGLVALLAIGTSLWMPPGQGWSWTWSTLPVPDHHAGLPLLLVGVFSLVCARLGHDARGSVLEARRAAEHAQIERLRAESERRMALVGLMGAVAHDIKNPLTAVQSLTSHLHRKAEGGSPLESRLGVVRTEVARIRSTVDRLLNAARPMGHRLSPDALDRIAAEVVDSHRALADGRGVTLVDATGPVMATFDRRKLTQVTGNLVLNAIEACSAGNRIELTAGRAGGGAWLEVRDDGPGIAADLRPLIARPGVSNKPGGSGIGLALSRSIVEQHGGRLELDDADGGGCRARIWLPAVPAHEPGGMA